MHNIFNNRNIHICKHVQTYMYINKCYKNKNLTK